MTDSHRGNRENRGISGRLGALTGHSLVKDLSALKCTGTLLLTTPNGAQLLLITDGQVKARHTLEGKPNLNDPDQRFHFQPGQESSTPQLVSRYPRSGVGVCRALPDLEPTLTLTADLIELRSLLQQLVSRGFSGAVSLDAPEGHALLLIMDGNVSAAQYESGAQIRSDLDALRAAQRLCLKPDTKLALHPLPEPIASALVGLALELAPSEPDGPLTGIQVDESGYTYLVNDTPYLHIPIELLGVAGRYSANPSPIPLRLPDEPPGWESRRYALTLRGRDALNPMTELAMTFRQTYGTIGRSVLKEVSGRRSVEEIARNLRIDMGELGPWLERLAKDGLIQSLDDEYLPRALSTEASSKAS